MNAKRGFVPEDERNFSLPALENMKTASRHVCYLLNEGYDLKQAVTFVGNHYLLSERQRLAIMRSVATQTQIENRKAKQVPLTSLSGREVWIDGFNMIITLEVLLSDSILFACMDGTIRDLAALRGTYRLIPETEAAILMLFDILREAGVSRVNILLDQPVSNSGRLKTCMADLGEEYPFLHSDLRCRPGIIRKETWSHPIPSYGSLHKLGQFDTGMPGAAGKRHYSSLVKTGRRKG